MPSSESTGKNSIFFGGRFRKGFQVVELHSGFWRTCSSLEVGRWKRIEDKDNTTCQEVKA